MNYFNRKKSREFAVQALYQWSITKESPTEIFSQFCEREGENIEKDLYFKEVVLGVIANIDAIDALILDGVVKNWQNLYLIDRAILRLAYYEIVYLNLHYKIAIHEAVRLSKNFSLDGSYKFINGNIDKYVKTHLQQFTNTQDLAHS